MVKNLTSSLHRLVANPNNYRGKDHRLSFHKCQLKFSSTFLKRIKHLKVIYHLS